MFLDKMEIYSNEHSKDVNIDTSQKPVVYRPVAYPAFRVHIRIAVFQIGRLGQVDWVLAFGIACPQLAHHALVTLDGQAVTYSNQRGGGDNHYS